MEGTDTCLNSRHSFKEVHFLLLPQKSKEIKFLSKRIAYALQRMLKNFLSLHNLTQAWYLKIREILKNISSILDNINKVKAK